MSSVYKQPILRDGFVTENRNDDPDAALWPATGTLNVYVKGGELYQQASDGVVSPLGPGSGGGGSISGIEIRDEGVAQTTVGTILDFVGNGVSASYSGGIATITVTDTNTVGVTLQSSGSGVATNATTLNFSNKFTVNSGGDIGLAETYLQTLGGTLTGALVLAADPAANMHPVTRQYLEAALVGIGSGDVQGPGSTIDNRIARYDGTTGKLIQTSGATVDDSGNLSATNLSGTNTGDQNLFSNVAVASQTTITSASTNGTLTMAAGANIALTTDNTTKTVTIGITGITSGGDVVGPSSATDNSLARYDGTTGKLIQGSGAIVDDSGNFTASGTVSGTNLSGTNTGDQNIFSTFAVSGQSSVIADGTSDTVTFAAGANISITTNAGTDTITISATGVGTGDVVGPASAVDNAIARFDTTTGKLLQNSAVTINDTGDLVATGTVTGTNLSGTNTGDTTAFGTIVIAGQSNVVADTGSDTLTLVAGANITLTTNAGTDTITIAAAGGSSSATLPVTQVGHGFAVLNGVRYDEVALAWVKAKADDPETLADGVVVSVSGNDFEVANSGPFTITHGLTTGEFYYLSDATAGAVTGTEPGDWSQPLFRTLSSTRIMILGYRPMPSAGGGASGDVVGPSSATDNALARYDTTSGKLLQNSAAILDDSGNLTLTGTITADNVVTWSEVTSTSQAVAMNKAYVANNAALITFTLPGTAVVGEVLEICGKGAGGWKLAQASGQTIHFGTVNSTAGTGGYVASTQRYDTIRLVCTTANTDFVVLSAVGNLTVI